MIKSDHFVKKIIIIIISNISSELTIRYTVFKVIKISTPRIANLKKKWRSRQIFNTYKSRFPYNLKAKRKDGILFRRDLIET